MAQIGKTYLYRIDNGYLGQLSRVFEAFTVVESEYVGNNTLAVGVPVKLSNGKVVPATASSDVVIGFSLRSFPAQSPNYGNANNSFDASQQWPAGYPAPILKRGYFMGKVQAGSPFKGGSVYIRTVALNDLVVGGLETGNVVAGTIAAAAGNTGNGTATISQVPHDAVAGTIDVKFTSATEFAFTYNSVSYTGTAGTAFDEAGFTFTITSGSTAFVANDKFVITMAANTDVVAITGAKFTGSKDSSGLVEIAYNI